MIMVSELSYKKGLLKLDVPFLLTLDMTCTKITCFRKYILRETYANQIAFPVDIMQKCFIVISKHWHLLVKLR